MKVNLESISEHMDTYQEQLCVDFQRAKLSSQVDSLIEVLATK